MQLPSLRLLSVAVVNSLLCNFVAIYSYTVLNVPQTILQDFVNNSFLVHFGYRLSAESDAALWGFLVCTWDIGGTVGALLTAWLDEKFGRKDTLFVLNNLFNLFSCTLILFAQAFNSFELLILGRFFSGLASGVAATLMGVFATECSPTKFRGFVGSFSFVLQPCICIMAMLLGLPNLMGSERHWCYLLSLSGFVSIVLICISPLFPDSPKYLYIEMKNRTAAAISVKFYYGNDVEVDDVFEEFDNEARLTKVTQETWRDILTLRHLRIPLILCCVANFSQDAMGSDIISNYSTEIIRKLSGMSAESAMYTSILALLPGVVAAVISTALIETAGRKCLLITGLGLATFANVLLMITGLVSQYSVVGVGGDKILAYTTAASVGLSAFGGYLGPASIPQFIFGEITPTSSRAFTAGASMAVNYASSVLYSFIYPPLDTAIQSYAFLIMILPSIASAVYLYLYLPEPRGKTVDEIVNAWILPKSNKEDESLVTNAGDNEESLDGVDETSPLLSRRSDAVDC